MRFAMAALLILALDVRGSWALDTSADSTADMTSATITETDGFLDAPTRTVVGDLSFLGGGVWPQGSLTRFSDPGPVFTARTAFHIAQTPGLIPWLDLGVVFFSSSSGLTEVETENLIVLAKEERSEWASFLHAGLQIGSPSRHGFFRPRAAAGPGFYLFIRDRNLTLPADTESFYSKTVALGRFGWRGTAGADLFFTPKWGVSVEFLYDQAWNVDDGQSARYAGFQVGVALPMERSLQ